MTYLPDSWRNREVVSAALRDVIRDFDKNASTWENAGVPGYLEALGALLMSIGHSYANTDQPIPDDPWVVIANAIKGAPYYE